MIEEYKFGIIVINKETYNNDLEVRWTDEILSWSRRKQDLIDIEDVKRALDQGPDVILIGKGYLKGIEITDEAKNEIKSRGVDLIIDATEEAVKTYNVINEESLEETGAQKKVIGLFHLTD